MLSTGRYFRRSFRYLLYVLYVGLFIYSCAQDTIVIPDSGSSNELKGLVLEHSGKKLQFAVDHNTTTAVVRLSYSADLKVALDKGVWAVMLWVSRIRFHLLIRVVLAVILLL